MGNHFAIANGPGPAQVAGQQDSRPVPPGGAYQIVPYVAPVQGGRGYAQHQVGWQPSPAGGQPRY